MSVNVQVYLGRTRVQRSLFLRDLLDYFLTAKIVKSVTIKLKMKTKQKNDFLS